jgi:hypothetical protein
MNDLLKGIGFVKHELVARASAAATQETGHG